LAACKRNKIDPATIGGRFQDDTGISIYDADADTITAFTKTLTPLQVVKNDA
jgi:hypothetical protein